MIYDVTEDLQQKCSHDIDAALHAIAALKKFCGRETVSAALGEISEVVVAKYLGAERSARNSRGHDLLLPNGCKIEVKSRLLGKWGDSLMFDFRPETKTCRDAYCVVWRDDSNQVELHQVIKVEVPYLTKRWAVSQPKYSARTNLGRLRRALNETSRL